MTITVTAPNGSTVQFPDGTDHETINGVMSQFHAASAPQPDKYQQAALDDNASLQAMGAPDTQGFTRRLVHGATLGADTTLSALATTPAEMIRHGTFDPTEGYSYAKAREDLNLQEARKNTGALGTAAEIAGGGMSGAGLASGGLTAARFLAPEAGLAARSAASAVDAAGLGGFSGAMEGNGVKDRFNSAMKGLGAGAAIGGLTPGALKLAGAALSPIASNIRARINPQGYAESQIARAIQESGKTPEDLASALAQANVEGQPQYAVADALGNPGQRMLSTVARSPGEGRTAVVDALENRQAGQGRRVANALSEGFGSRMTPAQLEDAMVAERGAIANQAYGDVRNGAQPVDVSGAVRNIDETLGSPVPAPEMAAKPVSAPVANVPAPENGPAPGKAQSLLEFIASKGGLGPDAELEAIGAHGHTVNVEGIGRRKLVRQGGLPLDYAREAAQEAGYLQGSHNGTSTTNDLLDVINAEIRGQKRYPAGHEGYQTKREAAAMSERDQHEYNQHISGLEDDLAAAGHGQLGPDVRKHALDLMSRNGMDADTAVEHAIMQLEQTDAAGVHHGSFPGDTPSSPVRGLAPNLPADSAAATLRSFRDRLTNGETSLSNFTDVQRLRGDLSDAIEAAKRSGANNKSRLLNGVLKEVDTALESSSPGYKQANRDFAQSSRNIEAIKTGRDAAIRGRTEDTIPAFQALPLRGQQAFRTGYVDPLIADVQKGAFGANKARPLTSDAIRQEFNAFVAPGRAERLQRQIGREQTMFETRNHALGGSRTADNLNDHAAMGVDPHLVGQIVTGNWHGAVRTALSAGHNMLSGNTPAVRREVANILLQNGGNISPARLRDMVNNTVARIQFVQNIARNVGRGAAGGLAVAAPSVYRNK